MKHLKVVDFNKFGNRKKRKKSQKKITISDLGYVTQLLLITDYHEFGSLYDYLRKNTLTPRQVFLGGETFGKVINCKRLSSVSNLNQFVSIVKNKVFTDDKNNLVIYSLLRLVKNCKYF